MQKVPQILRQKQKKNLKKLCFSNQKATKTAHIKKKNNDLLH